MTRKHFLAASGPTLLLLLPWTMGCSRPPASSGPSKGKDPSAIKKADQFQQVLEILQSATESAGFREALTLASGDLARAENLAKLRLSAERRDFMRQRLGLDDEDMADVESTTFRPLDSHHVQQCFLLRDVARTIERSGARPLDQARQALSWVDRHLLLLERADELLPPYFALRQGEGTAHERALVFLAILDQLQIQACLVSLGESADGGPGRVFAGAVIGDDPKKEIYLFDPRMGRPVTGASGICTLAELRKAPKVHFPDRKDKAESPVARVFVPVSMPALSPRMKYLEDRLAVHDRVVLSAAPERWHKSIAEAAGQEVLPWTSAKNQAGRSPLRMLSAFLPPGEGGRDTTSRHLRADARSLPWLAIQSRYASMRLHEELPPPAQQMLFHITNLLFQRYVRDPRLALAGGHVDRAVKRLDWMRTVLDDLEFAPLTDADLRRHAEKFREQVNVAYLALVRKQAGGQELVNRVWGQDRFMDALLQAKDRPDPKDKQELTFIMLSAVREPLGERVYFLNALCWQDHAERSQAVLEAQQKNAGAGKAVRQRAAEKATSDWVNARGWWQSYVERSSIAPPVMAQRLERLRQVAAMDLAAGQHQDLASMVHRAVAGRLFLAEGQLKLKQHDAARSALERLRADLSDLRERSGWDKDIAALLERAKGGRQQLVGDNFKGLGDNLAPGGGIFWLEKRVDELLSSTSPKTN